MQNGNLKGVEAIRATQTISFSVPNQEYVSATVESSGLKKKSGSGRPPVIELKKHFGGLQHHYQF